MLVTFLLRRQFRRGILKGHQAIEISESLVGLQSVSFVFVLLEARGKKVIENLAPHLTVEFVPFDSCFGCLQIISQRCLTRVTRYMRVAHIQAQEVKLTISFGVPTTELSVVQLDFRVSVRV